MSTVIKWLVVIIVIAGAGAALWWSGWIKLSAPASSTQTTETAQNNTQQSQTAQSDLPTPASDTSDTALGQDAAAVDAQMSAYTTDSANVDQSLNDTPTAQEY